LSSFVDEQKILGGFVFGLGAFKDLTLGYYDSTKKEYIKKFIRDDLEFGNLTGSIAYVEGKPFVDTFSPPPSPALANLWSFRLSPK